VLNGASCLVAHKKPGERLVTLPSTDWIPSLLRSNLRDLKLSDYALLSGAWFYCSSWLKNHNDALFL
jgi:hypothetical protein